MKKLYAIFLLVFPQAAAAGPGLYEMLETENAEVVWKLNTATGIPSICSAKKDEPFECRAAAAVGAAGEPGTYRMKPVPTQPTAIWVINTAYGDVTLCQGVDTVICSPLVQK